MERMTTLEKKKMEHESSHHHYEWHRERILREKKYPNSCSQNRVDWNRREIEKRHGERAAKEMMKEFGSKSSKRKQYFV